MGQFLDYCTYGHMIDNVVLIVTGTLHERDVHVRSSFSTFAVNDVLETLSMQCKQKAATALIACFPRGNAVWTGDPSIIMFCSHSAYDAQCC